MNLLYRITFAIIVVTLAGCGHTGIYSKGYYSGRTANRQSTIHVVQAGETLYSIAWQYGHDYRQVARWNAIKSPYTIFPQQQLKVTRLAGDNPTQTRKLTKINKSNRMRADRNIPLTRPEKSNNKLRHASQKLVWRWPVKGKILSRFSASDPGQKGIDIAGSSGQPIYAAEQGYVVYSGSGLRGYGELIIVKHNETFLSAYAHNQKLRVKEGQKVKKGEHIADMGKTGAERVKLHFEIRQDGIPVNPFRYLPKQ